MQTSDWKYDVALSFAGEDRHHALDLAMRLHSAGYLVFFDRFEELWGQDLTIKLQDVYSRQSRFCVVFVSEHYLRTPWTNYERQMLVMRALRQDGSYLLPIRLDDSTLPGLSEAIAYKDLRRQTPAQIFESLRQVIGPPCGAQRAPTFGSGEPARVRLYPSDFLYPVVQNDSRNTARFNLGCQLANYRDTLEHVRRFEAIVTPREQFSIQFTWQLFYDLAKGARDMQRMPEVMPLSLSPGESRLLGIQFVGPRLDDGLIWHAGDYEVDIVGWVGKPVRDANPDLRSRFAMHISLDEAMLFSWWANPSEDHAEVLKVSVAVPVSIDRSTLWVA